MVHSHVKACWPSVKASSDADQYGIIWKLVELGGDIESKTTFLVTAAILVCLDPLY